MAYEYIVGGTSKLDGSFIFKISITSERRNAAPFAAYSSEAGIELLVLSSILLKQFH